MNNKQNTEDPMLAAIDRICNSVECAGAAGKATGTALRAM